MELEEVAHRATRRINPRTERARSALMQAAFDLVSQQSVSQISLTEIAEEAGVSRPTVYKQFRDTPTLVAYVTEQSLNDILEEIDSSITVEDSQIYFRQLMNRFVSAVYADKEFYRNAIYGPSAAQIMIGVAKMLDARMETHQIGRRLSATGEGADDLRAAISAGVVWLLVRWLDSDFEGDNSAERIAERIADTMFTLSGTQTQ